jgi:hypothetical protein
MAFQNSHVWTQNELESVEQMLQQEKTHREIGATLGGISRGAVAAAIRRHDLKHKTDQGHSE